MGKRRYSDCYYPNFPKQTDKVNTFVDWYWDELHPSEDLKPTKE